MTAVPNSIDALLGSLYEAISGPAGSWDPEAERHFFWPGARLCRSGVDEAGKPWLRSMDFDEYVADVVPFLKQTDFFETEVRRETHRFGNLAQVRSYYEARHSPSDQQPERRGINFMELYFDGDRWWILAMAWDNDRPGIPRSNVSFQPPPTGSQSRP